MRIKSTPVIFFFCKKDNIFEGASNLPCTFQGQGLEGMCETIVFSLLAGEKYISYRVKKNPAHVETLHFNTFISYGITLYQNNFNESLT